MSLQSTKVINLRAWRGVIFTFLNEKGTPPHDQQPPPSTHHLEPCTQKYRRQHSPYLFLQDGIVAVNKETGLIYAVEDAKTFLHNLRNNKNTSLSPNDTTNGSTTTSVSLVLDPQDLTFCPKSIIMPGFVDTHVHMPQVEMIGSYGGSLLYWLENFTFPAERKFSDIHHSKRVAKFFVNEMLRNGTTTALVFGTVHAQSVDALFEECSHHNMRIIAGKVMMDKGPEGLQDTAESSYLETKQLIEKWHGHSRLLYAVTPRFAITSSDEQLAGAGRLLKEHPSVYVHTHLNESVFEIERVAELFPSDENYLGVYDRHGLVGPRSIFAHCIHCKPAEWDTFKNKEGCISFCPSSNMFLGSGLFPRKRAFEEGVRVGMGTDVGAGTSMSILKTLDAAYKVMQLSGDAEGAHPFNLLYDATLGGAISLSLGDKIGSLEPGKEADFIVLDVGSSSMMRHRMNALFPPTSSNSDIATTPLSSIDEKEQQQVQQQTIPMVDHDKLQGDFPKIENETKLAELLFMPMVLSDENTIRSTVVMGVPRYNSSVQQHQPTVSASSSSIIVPAEATAHHYQSSSSSYSLKEGAAPLLDVTSWAGMSCSSAYSSTPGTSLNTPKPVLLSSPPMLFPSAATTPNGASAATKINFPENPSVK